jgi:Flp pilus assembly protein TadB
VSGGALLVVLVFAALVVGIASVLGAPLLAIPIILLLPGPIITLEFLRRQYRQRQVARFRESARARKIHFDARDEETLSR